MTAITFGNAKFICELRNGDIAALPSLFNCIDSENGDTHTPYCVIYWDTVNARIGSRHRGKLILVAPSSESSRRFLCQNSISGLYTSINYIVVYFVCGLYSLVYYSIVYICINIAGYKISSFAYVGWTDLIKSNSIPTSYKTPVYPTFSTSEQLSAEIRLLNVIHKLLLTAALYYLLLFNSMGILILM